MVCRIFGRIEAIRRMAGRNPMSSMRSASSRTSVCSAPKATSLRSRKSSRRPGVATTRRAPLRMAVELLRLRKVRRRRWRPREAACRAGRCIARRPAWRAHAWERARVPRFRACSAREAFPSPGSGTRASCRFLSARWRARPLPCRACGMAAACTGVGSVKFAACNFSFM